MPRLGHQTATAPTGDDAGAAVIAFRRRGGAAGRAASIVLRAEDRPPLPAPRRHGTALLLLLGSVAVHAAGVALLDDAPRPMPSAGIPAIAVDIVIGDNAAAGIASTPGQESAVEIKPAETVTPEPATATAEPVKPTIVAETATPVLQSEPLPAHHVEAVPKPAETVEAVREPAKQMEAVKPDEVVATTPPARHRPPATAAAAASGISRGGSAADANFHGQVAAHLARHKRFPPEARRRGEHGNAGVDFSIDGNGRVTAVRIARTSGFASLDRAAETMVWRASPFPAPPDRQPQRFRVPISYSFQ